MQPLTGPYVYGVNRSEKLVQYAKNLGGKSQKNLVEHQIIKNDKKIQ